MLAQGMQNFMHLKHRRQGFDQHGRANAAARQAEVIFGEGKYIGPPFCLAVMFEFWQIVVDAGSAAQSLLVIEVEVERKINQRAGDDLAVDENLLVRKRQAAHPGDEQSGITFHLIVLAAIGIPVIHIGAGIVIGIPQVFLAVYQAFPGR